MVDKFGDWFSYNQTARANIFRRDHVKVTDLDSMLKLMRSVRAIDPGFKLQKTNVLLSFLKQLMMVRCHSNKRTYRRYNDFKHDPLSRCNCTPPYSGENAISARSDLNPANGTYPFGALGHRSHGGTDSKVRGRGLFCCTIPIHCLSQTPSDRLLVAANADSFFSSDNQLRPVQSVPVPVCWWSHARWPSPVPVE